MAKQRRIIILAGPNGAGKTTFAREYLLKEAHCPDFVNVDLIAAGLSPFDPARAAIRAGRIMLAEIQRRTRKGESFAFETTLSGHMYARLIPEWRTADYQVRLIFLSCRIRKLRSRVWLREWPRVVTMWQVLLFVGALIQVYVTFKMFIWSW